MTCDRRRARLSLAVAATCGVGLSVLAPAAWAQSEDPASARALFEEGRRLLKAGQYSTACPKLEAARKLYTSAGILLNLADCHEKIGRTASAWTEFGEAATVASRTNRAEDAEEAKRRQAALEPALARVVVRVSRPVAGLVVKRDGAILADAAWGIALPVDPGAHAIRAEAPGFEQWTASITVSRPGQREEVEVPELRALAAATGPGKLDTTEKTSGSVAGVTGVTGVTATAAPRSGRTLPWVLIGSGAAVGVGGGVLMLVESGRASTARSNKDPAGYDATRTPWKVGLVGAIVGVAGVAAGVALLAIGPSDASASAPSLSAWIDGSSRGVSLAGSW